MVAFENDLIVALIRKQVEIMTAGKVQQILHELWRKDCPCRIARAVD